MDTQYKWTDKLPALIAGLIAVFAGLLVVNGRWRYAGIVGLSLIFLGLTSIYYSTTIKEWCAPAETKFGTMQWGDAAFHSPSILDCVKLVK